MVALGAWKLMPESTGWGELRSDSSLGITWDNADTIYSPVDLPGHTGVNVLKLGAQSDSDNDLNDLYSLLYIRHGFGTSIITTFIICVSSEIALGYKPYSLYTIQVL